MSYRDSYREQEIWVSGTKTVEHDPEGSREQTYLWHLVEWDGDSEAILVSEDGNGEVFLRATEGHLTGPEYVGLLLTLTQLGHLK